MRWEPNWIEGLEKHADLSPGSKIGKSCLHTVMAHRIQLSVERDKDFIESLE